MVKKITFLYWDNNEHKCFRSSRPEVFCRKDVLRNFAKLTEKHLCQSLFFNEAAGLGEISKNTFFNKTPPLAAPHVSYTAVWFLQL